MCDRFVILHHGRNAGGLSRNFPSGFVTTIVLILTYHMQLLGRIVMIAKLFKERSQAINARCAK